jgi:hypothetical protein
VHSTRRDFSVFPELTKRMMAEGPVHARPEARPFSATEAHNQPAIRPLSETI